MTSNDELRQIGEAVILGQSDTVTALIGSALERKVEASRILAQVMLPAMDEVGRRMREGEYFIPEVLVSARAMKNGVELLRPYIGEDHSIELGSVVVGTVRGDLHDIGKNLVALMLDGVGFNVIDLGVDVSPEDFVVAVRGHKPKIVCLSAILTTTMQEMGAVIERLVQEGLRDDIKILVGGAPVSEQFTKQIGADGTAPECGSAAELAKRVIGAV
jgi:5-methyltetrahydrofolate--homocysteine methyltransferase